MTKKNTVSETQKAWAVIKPPYATKSPVVHASMCKQLAQQIAEINSWYDDDEYPKQRVQSTVGHTEEWILRLYGLCSQIWADLGFEKSRVFDNAVFAFCILPFIDERRQEASVELGSDERFIKHPLSARAVHKFQVQIEELKKCWHVGLVLEKHHESVFGRSLKSATAEPIIHVNASTPTFKNADRTKRGIQKTRTQSRHAKWNRIYRRLQKEHPGKTKKWYAQHITKMPEADGAKEPTIRRNLRD